MTRPSFVGVLAVLLLSACGNSEAPPEETEVTATEEYTALLADRQLFIDGYNGSLTITGHNDSTATFEVTKQAQGTGDEAAQALLDGITIESREGADTYTFHVMSSQPEQTAAAVDAHVPYKTPIRLDLENGDVRVEAISAPIRAVVDNGAVGIKGAANDIEVEVGNGNVTVNMVGFREETEVEITVNNGNIELTVPPSTAATVEAATQVGQINASGLSLEEPEESTTTSGMHLTGQLGNGTGRIHVRTENGSITLRGGQ